MMCKLLCRLRRVLSSDRAGSMFIWAMIIFFIFIALLMLILDYVHVAATYNSVDTVLERCALSTVETAARDNYRQEYDSTLDESEALALFDEFVGIRLGLTDGKFIDAHDRVVYSLESAKAEVEEMQGTLTITGTLHIPLRYYALLGITLDIPFKVTASQVRIDD